MTHNKKNQTMLGIDAFTFETDYAEAYRFIEAANKRSECYSLCKKIHSGAATEKEEQRANFLMRDSACHEKWFLDDLAKNFKLGVALAPLNKE